MGFLGGVSALKGANNSWGYATGSCVDGVGYIGPKNIADNRSHELMVSCSAMKEPIVFGREGVARVDTLFATSSWVKYRIVLKDGKELIVTINAMEIGQQRTIISMGLMNFEWWLAGVLYK